MKVEPVVIIETRLRHRDRRQREDGRAIESISRISVQYKVRHSRFVAISTVLSSRCA